MLKITANSSHSCGPKDRTRGVGAWAGATPVWAALCRPDLLVGSRHSEVAPAHAFVVSSWVKIRRKR
jgi:hypothetical protein